MILNLFKSSPESIRANHIRNGYVAHMSGLDIKTSTEINFLALNYDGVGGAIVEEFTYKAKEGLFGKAEYNRTVKVITAAEVKALIENPDFVLDSATE